MSKILTPIKEDIVGPDKGSLGEAVTPLEIYLPANLADALQKNASRANLSPENYVLFVLDFHLGKGSLLDHFMNAPVSYE